MKIVVELSLKSYDSLIEKCETTSREYAMLTRGVLIRRPKADHFERIMEFQCDYDEINQLKKLAQRFYPEAVREIEKSISTLNEL